MKSSYNVRVYKTLVYTGKRKTTHTVRWTVEGKSFRKPFATASQADSFRSELVTATRHGKAFDVTSGLPLSMSTRAAQVNWYDFAVEFVDVKWPHASANNRKNIAKALTATTVALLRKSPMTFEAVEVRTALREYAFNRNRRTQATARTAAILRWVKNNSPTMAVWEDTEKVEETLAAVVLKLDGKPMAASSVKRTLRILNVLMEHAVRRHVLPGNPLPKGRSTSPATASAVDKRCLINKSQAARLLAHIQRRPRGGERLHAFFATLYYAGPRPEEAVAMTVDDVQLPAQGVGDSWGELLFHSAAPEVGRQWTDTGRPYDERHLKGRAKGDTRPVPCHPALVRILREHIAREGLASGDRLFRGERGGELAGSVIRRAWSRARRQTLTETEYDSPLGKRVYDLRHTCLTGWLNNGIPPAQVAEWAGNSVPVLLSTYARCLSGQREDLQRRIEAAQDLTGLDSAITSHATNFDTYSTRTPAAPRYQPDITGRQPVVPRPAPPPGGTPRHAR